MTNILVLEEFEIETNRGIDRFQEKLDGFLVMCRLLGCKVEIGKAFVGVKINITKNAQGRKILIAGFHFISFISNNLLHYILLEIPLDRYEGKFHNPYHLYDKMDYLVKKL